MDKNSIVVKESIRNSQNADSLKQLFFGGIYGLVVDNETREALSAEIKLESTNNIITAKTDSSGWFYLGYVPFSSYDIKIISSRYDTSIIQDIKVDTEGWQRYILRLNQSNPIRRY